jgi:hypothetical protein
MFMCKYLQKLHIIFHEDYGLKHSPTDIVNKIKRDCISVFSNKLESIAFYDRTQGQVIEEILQYNYDMEDIQHMTEVEQIELYPFLNWLNENCVKRTEPQWSQFGIHELIANGKANPGTIGVKRTQFCKYCGEAVNLGQDVHASSHAKRLKT